MAYSTSSPPQCLVPRVGSGAALWYYVSTDAHTDVDASGYFTNGEALGMKVNDVVLVVDSDAVSGTIHVVTAVSTTATVSVATLA